MAEFSESDGFQGYKTRISEFCEIESTQPSLKEHHAKSFSPKQQPSAIVSSVKAETESENGHSSKSKYCSSDESEPQVDVVQEKQETEEDKLGFSEGGVVCEKGQELKDCEVGLSENQEIGEASSSSGLFAKEIQKHVVVEDPKKVWDAVYVSFDENEYEYCLRNKEEGCLVEPAVESVVDAVKIKEEFHNLSWAVDGNLETVEIPNTDRKGSVCEGMHNVAGSDGEKVDGLEENGENKKCSLKIEVIDETAVIETIPGDEFGNGIGKEKGFMSCGKHSEMNVHKNLIKQEGKKEKRPRRKGKGAKQLWGTNGKENIPTHMVEKRSDEAKRAYSRQEMEALRFVNLEAQRKKWLEVYCGLAPTVTKEYEGLIDFDNQKHIRLNFDPRHQFGKKEKKTPGILGEDCPQIMHNEMKNMDLLDDACGLSVSGEYDYAGEEAECSGEDDSDDDYTSIQKPAFLVKGEPNFDSGPPQDGFEYLRRVRWEAAHVPKVKVAKLERSKLNKEQTAYMPKIPDIEKCPEHLLPLRQWESAFIADFSELRLAVSHVEGSAAKISAKPQFLLTIHRKESSNLLTDSIISEKHDNLTPCGVESKEALVCFMPENSNDSRSFLTIDKTNPSPSLENPDPKSFKNVSSSNRPTLPVILEMDSVARLSMLRKQISSVEQMGVLSRNDCEWLFALCAAIDMPLDADTCAALRCLLRKCASLRAEKLELDDEAVMLNILATITGKYFGQSEFCGF